MFSFEMMKKSAAIEQINISEFKARCLRLLDETGRKGKEYLIARKGIPLAYVIPAGKKKKGIRRGSLKGLAEIHGDIVHCDTSSDWDVLKT